MFRMSQDMADPSQGCVGSEEGGEVIEPKVTEPKLLSMKQLAERWGVTHQAVLARLKKYGEDVRSVSAQGKQTSRAITESEADRIHVAVLDAKAFGRNAGGRASYHRQEATIKRHKERRENVVRHYGSMDDDDCSFLDKKRVRKPGEIVAILGTVVDREPTVRYCEECVNCIQRTTGKDRYVGCLEGMLSMDPSWEHKKGVSLFATEKVDVVERKRDADGYWTAVPALLDVCMIRRAEVKLYEPCAYFIPRVYVEHSDPIDDNPTNWEIVPETEEQRAEG